MSLLMSKAFTKESDGEEEPDLGPDDAAEDLPPGTKNYMTPAGAERLRAEWNQLAKVERPKVVDVVSYQKQIIGREISAGVFDFLDGNVFDISAGDGGLEPVQLAVRALIERATVEFMANLYGAPGPEVCLNAGPDPLGGTVGPTGGFYAAYPNTDTNNGETRADPSRWHDRRDDAVRRSRY